MKKIIVLFLFFILAYSLNAQIFKPVQRFNTKYEKDNMLTRGVIAAEHKWQWRFDATVAISELSYDKELKQLVSKEFSAVGPAIGYQHYVPRSIDDPTPFNNYGVSAAFLLGQSIYNPDLAAAKIALQANIMQYIKFGVTYTISTPTNISHIGAFFGGGFTF